MGNRVSWVRALPTGLAMAGQILLPLAQRVNSADGSVMQPTVQSMPEPEGWSEISFPAERTEVAYSSSTSKVQLSGVSRATPARLFGQLSLR